MTQRPGAKPDTEFLKKGSCRKMIKKLRKMAFSNGQKTGKINKSSENKKFREHNAVFAHLCNRVMVL